MKYFLPTNTFRVLVDPYPFNSSLLFNLQTRQFDSLVPCLHQTNKVNPAFETSLFANINFMFCFMQLIFLHRINKLVLTITTEKRIELKYKINLVYNLKLEFIFEPAIYFYSKVRNDLQFTRDDSNHIHVSTRGRLNASIWRIARD